MGRRADALLAAAAAVPFAVCAAWLVLPPGDARALLALPVLFVEIPLLAAAAWVLRGRR